MTISSAIATQVQAHAHVSRPARPQPPAQSDDSGFAQEVEQQQQSQTRRGVLEAGSSVNLLV